MSLGISTYYNPIDINSTDCGTCITVGDYVKRINSLIGSTHIEPCP